MENLRKLLITLIVSTFALIFLVFLGIFLINRFTSDKPEKVEVNSQLILEKITDQYFIVTKTVYIDEEVNINVDKGSSWSNFWWGKNVDAEGLMRVDVGVDLNELTEGDIEVDQVNKVVKIKLPKAKVLDSSLSGDIEVRSSGGILQKLFKSDSNKDFNEALNALTKNAEGAVLADKELLEEAEGDSIKLIELIVGNLGYTLQIEESQ